MFRCAPNEHCGNFGIIRMAFSVAGALASKLADVTLPRAMRSKIASLTSRLIPRSSAFTITCTSRAPSSLAGRFTTASQRPEYRLELRFVYNPPKFFGGRARPSISFLGRGSKTRGPTRRCFPEQIDRRRKQHQRRPTRGTLMLEVLLSAYSDFRFGIKHILQTLYAV